MSERKAFLLRIDPDLYEALARWAGDELRSLNGQIEYLLRQATVQSGRTSQRDRAAERHQRLEGRVVVRMCRGGRWKEDCEGAGRVLHEEVPVRHVTVQ